MEGVFRDPGPLTPLQPSGTITVGLSATFPCPPPPSLSHLQPSLVSVQREHPRPQDVNCMDAGGASRPAPSPLLSPYREKEEGDREILLSGRWRAVLFFTSLGSLGPCLTQTEETSAWGSGLPKAATANSRTDPRRIATGLLRVMRLEHTQTLHFFFLTSPATANFLNYRQRC